MVHEERNREQASALLREGRALAHEGQHDAAAERFRAAYALAAWPVIANNWALSRHRAGDHASVLNVLQPLLTRPDPVPFARALASEAHLALDRRAEAMKCLVDAISDLDWGLSILAREGIPGDPLWDDYTVPVKHAAGELGEHRLVLDLHRRWPGQDKPDGVFYAGVAAFNCGEFDAAARYWESATEPGRVRLMGMYAAVARAADQGFVPPFPLEYEANAGMQRRPNQMTPQRALLVAQIGSVRVRFLAMVFSGIKEAPGGIFHAMITQGGEWGAELARRLLQVNGVAMPMKMGAARTLLDLGVLAPGDRVSIRHGGRQIEMVARNLPMITADRELEIQQEEAIDLRYSGQREAAFQRFNAMWELGRLDPPGLISLSDLLRERGDLDTAQSLLEGLEYFAPDDTQVLLSLMQLWQARHDVDRARRYLNRIDLTGAAADLRRIVRQYSAWLEEEAKGNQEPAPRDTTAADARREALDQQAIATDLSIDSALKGLPVEWLNATAEYLGVGARLRRERQQQVAFELSDRYQLRELCADLSPWARDALGYVLQKGGWVPLPQLTNRFGSQRGDGFRWDKESPGSIIGQLRVRSLLFVGQAPVGKRAKAVAVVPVELREALAALV